MIANNIVKHDIKQVSLSEALITLQKNTQNRIEYYRSKGNQKAASIHEHELKLLQGINEYFGQSRYLGCLNLISKGITSLLERDPNIGRVNIQVNIPLRQSQYTGLMRINLYPDNLDDEYGRD